MWTSSRMKTRRTRHIAGQPRRLNDFAHIVDAGVGRRVHLGHVRVSVGRMVVQLVADAARLDGGLALPVGTDAVEAARDDTRRGGLAHAAHAGQHQACGMRPRRKHWAGCAPAPPARSGRRTSSDGICAPARGRSGISGAGVPPAPRLRTGPALRAGAEVRLVRRDRPETGRHTGRSPDRLTETAPFCGVRAGGNGRREPTTDPDGDPLRLLPSGPDRVGEASVRHRSPEGSISCSATPEARLADQRDQLGIGSEPAIRRVEAGRNGQCLSDQQTVKRVAVMVRKIRDRSGDLGRDRQFQESRFA